MEIFTYYLLTGVYKFTEHCLWYACWVLLLQSNQLVFGSITKILKLLPKRNRLD